jgi:hypothetical protein
LRTGHCRGFGPVRNEKRSKKRKSSRISESTGHSRRYGPTAEKVRMRECEEEKAKTLNDDDTTESPGNLKSEPLETSCP